MHKKGIAMNQKEIILNTLQAMKKGTPGSRVIIGFDGFVDEIIDVVDERIDSSTYRRVMTINDFSERIARAAGLSANLELVTRKIKLGGNGPIMADAMLSQGYHVTYIGALGKREVHPVFRDLQSRLHRYIPLAEPSHTDALEFQDGKIMLGKMTDLKDVDWDNLLKQTSSKEITDMIGRTDLLACTNWTMLSGMNSILLGLLTILDNIEKKPVIFIDLADPQKRTVKDIQEVLQLLGELATRTNLILGMNKHESEIIAEVCGISEEILTRKASVIREQLGLGMVVIHPVDGAAAATQKEDIWIAGPFTREPVLTTGAGDNFNAGFCSGLIAGMNLDECLVNGVCTSGFYVRNGRSPSWQELIDFAEKWSEQFS